MSATATEEVTDTFEEIISSFDETRVWMTPLFDRVPVLPKNPAEICNGRAYGEWKVNKVVYVNACLIEMPGRPPFIDGQDETIRFDPGEVVAITVELP